MITVACVLRSGGEYAPEHVQSLAAQVAVHLPGARLVCLTDTSVPGVNTVPLPHAFPGWWSKLNLFAPGVLRGRVLYFDLDTVVLGDLSRLAAYRGPFAMLRDFMRPHRLASGVMAWDANGPIPACIWDAFNRDPLAAMYDHGGGGDQSFIASVVGPGVDRLQDFVPPAYVCSYKVDVLPNGGVSNGCAVLCAHGQPKPWDDEWQL